MEDRLRLLMVEDSEEDAELICLELQKAGFELDWRSVDTEEEFVSALQEPWDIIISDFQMPRFDGLKAFAVFRERKLDTPFMFVSGVLGEERAVQAMRAGARDYLLKGNLARLSVAVKRELAAAKGRLARRQAEEAARREQRRLSMAVEASGSGVFEYRIPPQPDTFFSERWAEILGYGPPELPSHERILDWYFGQVHPDDLPTVEKAYEDLVHGRTQRFAVESRIRHKDGHWVDVAAFARALERDASGRATHVGGVLLDIREQRKLEEQLRQAQKMEAIGRLAGGVAHDFNNLLTAISGFGNFVLEALRQEGPVYRDMQEVLKAAKRAETLTAQLLAFSRRKPVAPRIVNLNGLVEEMDRMLQRVVGEDVDVATRLAPALWNVHIDPGSLEQVIVNLAVNARDAMPDGGSLTIETDNTALDEDHGRAHGANVPLGEYVLLAVSDDGVGMDSATQKRIFEPFFTTKEAGRGTGLGLAVCYGIVKQAGGYIWVNSELGKGTTFKIYLPRVTRKAEILPARPEPASLQGSETILVVEDDDQVRRLAVRSLTRLGYRVIEASSGEDALLKCDDAPGQVDLLLTDVVMPEVSGKELAEKMSSLQPSMKILYMSGYTQNAIIHRGVLDTDVHVLRKPFTPDTLARNIREVLDG